MLVETPRMRNSARARCARRTAIGKVRAAAGQLDEHRVEVGAHLGADEDGAAVEAHAAAAGGAVDRDGAGVGTEAVGRVLRRDAALHREALGADVVLAQPHRRERVARRDLHLHDDEVDVGDLLGDRVLDLDARVHLDEDVAPVLAEEELDGAGVDVADRAGEARRRPHTCWRGCRRRGWAPGRSRRPSGDGAGASSRARRGGRPRRCCPRAPGPRCAAG